MTDIIKSGLQIVCSRKNANVAPEDRKADPVIDEKQIKFYTKLSQAREEQAKNNKPLTPMFRCELVHWDENGDIKKTNIVYQTLAPDQVAAIHNVLLQRLSPSKPKGPKPAAVNDAPAATGEASVSAASGDAGEASSAGTEAGEAAGAEGAVGEDEAAEAKAAEAKAAADKEAADKAAADKKKSEEKTAADKKAAADKKKADEAKAAEAKAAEGKPKSAAEKAREVAVNEQKKADEAKAAAEAAKPAAGGDFDDLFSEE